MLQALLDVDPQSYIMLAIVAVLVVVIVVFYILSNKKRKKQEQDAQDLINAVKPGNKVKTIGGICGIVVEVDNEENTFVLETGTEKSGKSFIKFDRQAIYQTDAVVEKKENTPAPESVDQTVAETVEPVAEAIAPADEPAEAPQTEPAVEPATEEKAEPKPKKSTSSKKAPAEKQVKF